MAAKQYVNFSGLSKYDELIKQYVGTKDAKSIKSLSVSGNTVSFFKTENASGTAAYTVNIPDVSGFMSKIASATGGKIVTSVAGGEVAESATAISDLATNAFVGAIPAGATATTVTGYAKEVADSKDSAIATAQSAAEAAQSDVDALETYVGEIPSTATATTVVGYAEEVADAVADDLNALDQSLSAVAKSGNAADVTYDNTTSGLTADDVQEAIDELAEASAGGVASKTIWFTDNSAGQSDYAKVYKIYQGANAPDAQSSPASLVGTINIPKDQVLQDASIVTITYSDGKLYDGTTDVTALIKGSDTPTSADAGKYMKFIMQNVTDPLYANLSEFIDIYTGGTTTEATVSISNANEITVTIGEIDGSKLAASSVAKAKLASGVQASLDLADSAVQSVAEGATNGTVAVDGTDVAVHGLGSAAYTASTAYDVAGAASNVQDTVTGVSTDTSANLTLYGLRAYADDATEAVPNSSIEGLFS